MGADMTGDELTWADLTINWTGFRKMTVDNLNIIRHTTKI